FDRDCEYLEDPPIRPGGNGDPDGAGNGDDDRNGAPNGQGDGPDGGNPIPPTPRGTPQGAQRPRGTPSEHSSRNGSPRPIPRDPRRTPSLTSILNGNRGPSRRRSRSPADGEMAQRRQRVEELQIELHREMDLLAREDDNARRPDEPRQAGPDVGGSSVALSTDAVRRHNGGSTQQAGSEFINEDLAEENMSHDEWQQGWRRTFILLGAHMPKYLPRWRGHYNLINERPNRSTHWRIWMAYDIQVRMITRTQPRVDPGTFQQAVWNDLLVDYLIKQANSSAPRPPSPRPTARQDSSRARQPSRATTSNQAGPSSSHRAATPMNHAPARRTPRPPVAPLSSHTPQTATGSTTTNRSATATTHQEAPAPHAPDASGKCTYAPCAAPLGTAHSSAHKDPRRIVTPLRPDVWRRVLEKHGLLEKFVDVPPGLTHGFPISSSNIISATSTPPNHKSALDNPTVVDKAIATECRDPVRSLLDLTPHGVDP
ncbi:hypothetical protein FRC07_012743, partial [Ceratobasidium sp. 392]